MLKRTTCLFFALTLSFSSWTPYVAARKTDPDAEAIRISRLVSLCKLWGYIKYFHPSLAYRSDIDWDAALIATIPKLGNVQTSQGYAAALQQLLNVLDDPLTRVINNSPPAVTKHEKKRQHFEYDTTDDNILLITVGNYFELWNQASQQKLRAVSEEIIKAKAIVFDLRSEEPVGEYGRFQLASSFRRIERLISSTPLLTVGKRSRIHRGFESNSAFSSGQYQYGFYIEDVRRIAEALPLSRRYFCHEALR